MATRRVTGTVLIVLGVLGIVIGSLVAGYAFTQTESPEGPFGGDDEQQQEENTVMRTGGLVLAGLSLLVIVLGIYLALTRAAA